MKTDAERARIYRERQRDGLVVVPVEVYHFDLVPVLIEGGLLSHQSAGSRAAIGRATSALIDELAPALPQYLKKRKNLVTRDG